MIELNKLLKLLKQVRAADLPVNDVLDDITLGQLRHSLCALFKFNTEDSKWAASTIMDPYAGAVLTDSLLTSIVCRLLSFKQQIKSGIAPSLWEGARTRAVMFCNGVSPAPEAKKPSLKLSLMCLLGEPAGLLFEVTISRLYLEYALGKFLGLSFKVYNSPAECISGSFFQCLVEEDTAGAAVTDISATETMKKLNREKMEARLGLLKCRTPQLDCWSCPKKRKECRLAVWK